MIELFYTIVLLVFFAALMLVVVVGGIAHMYAKDRTRNINMRQLPRPEDN